MILIKKYKTSFLGIAIFSAVFFVSSGAITVFAKEMKTVVNTKVFKVKLGASRIIYNPDSKGASLTVSNLQEYPILVQGKVYAEDKNSVAPFIVTPPIFRLDAQQQSRLRIIRTDDQMRESRETLYWACVAGIPPKNTDVWAEDVDGKTARANVVSLNLNVNTHSCIKLLVRPSGIKGTPMEGASALEWRLDGDRLKVTNPSAFYVNLSSLSVGDMDISNLDYVAPRSSRSFTLPKGAGGLVKWKVITDEGGESRQFQVSLQSVGA